MSARLTQAERSASTRGALLEAAAGGFSRYGFTGLVLEEVARAAGCTRGALYHQFADKEDLARATLAWVDDAWKREVGGTADGDADPAAALIALARAHAVFCRRDVARVMIVLRIEFGGRDHPIGREVEAIYAWLVNRCARLVSAGRQAGSIPPGPPPRATALALVGAVEGAVIELAGRAPLDEIFAARAVAGILGLAESSAT